MSVSDKDRDAALNLIYETPCFNETFMNDWYTPTMGSAIKIVDTLIAHGWGPRPTVTRAAVSDVTSELARLERLTQSRYFFTRDTLTRWLRGCGIEVSE